MKNIHVLPTDKPSRLSKSTKSGLNAAKKGKGLYESGRFGITTFNIYITSDEEIKKGTWCLLDHNVGQSTGYSVLKCLHADVENGEYLFQDKDGDKFTTGRCDKIILTTDQDLMQDGVQSIPDKFLEWFVKNPCCEEVEIEFDYNSYKLGKVKSRCYKIIIPKEEPNTVFVTTEQATRMFGAKKLNKMLKNHKQETLEENCTCTDECLGYLTKTCKGIETLEQIDQNNPVTRGSTALLYKQETLEEVAEKYKSQFIGLQESRYASEDFINGAKWQQERSYSEEDMRKAFIAGFTPKITTTLNDSFNKWFKTFKK